MDCRALGGNTMHEGKHGFLRSDCDCVGGAVVRGEDYFHHQHGKIHALLWTLNENLRPLAELLGINALAPHLDEIESQVKVIFAKLDILDASPHHRTIAHKLLTGRQSTDQLASICGVDPRQMRRFHDALKDGGLVEMTCEGREVFYSLREPELIEGILKTGALHDPLHALKLIPDLMAELNRLLELQEVLVPDRLRGYEGEHLPLVRSLAGALLG